MTRTANRARPRSGIQIRLTPAFRSSAFATSAKSACSGSVTATRRSAESRRLFMFLLLVLAAAEVGDTEFAFEVGQPLDVDRADDVDHRELARLGGDDHQTDHPLAAHVGPDVHVLFLLAADRDQRLPGVPELALHAVDELAVVLPVVVELVAADVDAFEAADHVTDGALIVVATV